MYRAETAAGAEGVFGVQGYEKLFTILLIPSIILGTLKFRKIPIFLSDDFR